MKYKFRIFKNKSFIDKRGFFWTSWKKELKLKMNFNHDKFSLSKKNVLRGLHGDSKTWKLVSCPYGKFLLVVVNYNKTSKDFLKWKSWILSHKNGVQVLIPPNFANGHLCLSDKCLFHYKLSYKGKYADVKHQFSLKWNDPKINIKWGIKNPILSLRDIRSKLL
tara:strand:+ start:65 stop:556 length:492 start_codon:yes stop_codon:yes gene_type:complete